MDGIDPKVQTSLEIRMSVRMAGLFLSLDRSRRYAGGPLISPSTALHAHGSTLLRDLHGRHVAVFSVKGAMSDDHMAVTWAGLCDLASVGTFVLFGETATLGPDLFIPRRGPRWMASYARSLSWPVRSLDGTDTEAGRNGAERDGSDPDMLFWWERLLGTLA